jgi:hypothetical protein
MVRQRADAGTQTQTQTQSVRYILGNNETPNQPVGEYLGKEFMRLKEIAKEPMECSICLDEICCNRCICLLTCGHHFHFMCIQRTSVCPLCRA